MDHTEQIIAESIDYLVAHYDQQPSLELLANRAGYEMTYFQKLFKDKVGISPKRLIQYMNMRKANELLNEGHSTMSAALQTGLSGTGRLYDLFVALRAVKPGDIQHKGKGLSISYGYHPSPLGELMIGKTEHGLCYLGFIVDEDRNVPFQKMSGHFPFASFKEDNAGTQDEAAHIMQIWTGHGSKRKKVKLDLHGTNLQIQVWQALLKIPCGKTVTYQSIAKQLGRPKAARAIGNAVGANPVSLLIPCHRVIRGTGIIDNYGWGSPRKKLILGLEANLNQD